METLFPAAQLKLCDVPCNINNVFSRITLSTSHIGKGCDRDTYSVQSQRKICGKWRIFFTPLGREFAECGDKSGPKVLNFCGELVSAKFFSDCAAETISIYMIFKRRVHRGDNFRPLTRVIIKSSSITIFASIFAESAVSNATSFYYHVNSIFFFPSFA